MSASCLIHLAAIVVTFDGQDSWANFTSPSISESLSSFLLQFKTKENNTRIVDMDYNESLFNVDIRSSRLHIAYNLKDAGNGSINIGTHAVSSDEWFLLNVTSQGNNTRIHLHKGNHDNRAVECAAEDSKTLNGTLFGRGFVDLFRTSGLQIGGKVDHPSLKPFKGCIGAVKLGNHRLELNQSQTSKALYFTRHISTKIFEGCDCLEGPCENGEYLWDQKKGSCECKCNIGFQGIHCINRTTTPSPSDGEDDVDEQFWFLVAGVTLGVVVVVTVVVVMVLYCRRTSSSAFGVYNPKDQEQVQGQQMNPALKIPPPEKLI